MSFTNEMSRIGAQFEVAQAARSAAIGAIGSGETRPPKRPRRAVPRDDGPPESHQEPPEGNFLHGRLLTRRRGGFDGSLCRRPRKEGRRDAGRFESRLVKGLQETVEGQLQHLSDRRTAIARQEGAARRTYLKDLRRRVHAVIGNAEKYVNDLHKDRTTAERVWEQHGRTSRRLRETAASGEAASRKRAVKAKKPRKAARH